MKSSNLFKIILSAISSILLMFATSSYQITASAANSYEPVTGSELYIEKYLIYSADTSCPETEFTYNIEPAAHIPPTGNKLEILPGNHHSVSNQPTIGTAVFNSSSEKFTTVQDVNSQIGQHKNIIKDPVSLNNNEAYSRYDVKLDFSNVTFSAPGVYRWKITEISPSENFESVNGKERYVDVYISQLSDTDAISPLKINGYILHSVENYQPELSETPADPIDQKGADTKAVGIISKDVSKMNSFIILNETTGNQGDHTKYFEYTVKLENLRPNSTIKLAGNYQVGNVPDKIVGAYILNAFIAKAQNPTFLQTDENGKILTTIYLKHNEYITFKNLTEGYSAEVTVKNNDYKSSGKYIVDTKENVENFVFKNSETGNITNFEGNSKKVNEIDKYFAIKFNNYRQGTIPTGIISTILPGLSIVVIGIAGIVLKIKEEKI